MNPQGEANMRQ